MFLEDLSFKLYFIGYDLLGYVDGSKSCPPETLIVNNATVMKINEFYYL